MPRRIIRHTGNYATILLLIFGMAVALDRFAEWLGFSPAVGCFVRPILHILLSRAVAVWAISIGVLLTLFPGTRRTGLALIFGGIAIGALPSAMEAYLGPLCRS